MGLDTLKPYLAFAERVYQSKRNLLEFIRKIRNEGKVLAALGASTKGNVLLQYCELTEKEVEWIGEVNVEKFGSYTPGTCIPIIPEQELLSMKSDYLLVLPWHFREGFITNKKFSGMSLVFPLPNLEVVDLF